MRSRRALLEKMGTFVPESELNYFEDINKE